MSECDHREFLLSALRAASLRAKLFDADIVTIGIALKACMISPTEAVAWLKELGADIGKIPDEIVKGDME